MKNFIRKPMITLLEFEVIEGEHELEHQEAKIRKDIIMYISDILVNYPTIGWASTALKNMAEIFK